MDIKSRKTILDKFLLNLSTERTKPKARKNKIIRHPLFDKGDCITFKFGNSNYGGGVVLEAISHTEYGTNLIALTSINQQQKPSMNDFKIASVLVKSFGAWNEYPDIGWYNAKFFKRLNIEVEIVGKMEIELSYSPNDHSQGYYFGGNDSNLVESPMRQFDFEKTTCKPSKAIYIKQLIKK